MVRILLVLVMFINFCLLGQDYDSLVPNSFTPNGPLNKEFYPITKLPYTMEIYNRWGELIFKGDRWDGKYSNKECSNGTYIWLIIINGKRYNGYVNLL